MLKRASITECSPKMTKKAKSNLNTYTSLKPSPPTQAFYQGGDISLKYSPPTQAFCQIGGISSKHTPVTHELLQVGVGVGVEDDASAATTSHIPNHDIEDPSTNYNNTATPIEDVSAVTTSHVPDHGMEDPSTKTDDKECTRYKLDNALTQDEFLWKLEELSIFDNPEIDELIQFENQLGEFGKYSKSILHLGRVGYIKYYIRVFPLSIGSINDEDGPGWSLNEIQFFGANPSTKRLIFIGRLIVGDMQSFWIVAMDSEHTLYALRASKIGPYEKYESDEGDCKRLDNLTDDTSIYEKSKSNNDFNSFVDKDKGDDSHLPTVDSPKSDKSSSAKSSRIGDSLKSDTSASFEPSSVSSDSVNSRSSSDLNNTRKDSDYSNWKTHAAPLTHDSALASQYGLDVDGDEGNILVKDNGVDEIRAENGFVFNDVNPYRPDDKEYGTFRYKAFNKKHSSSANVFNATDTQHVFILGHLDLLQRALQDPEQELHPQLLPEVTSWINMNVDYDKEGIHRKSKMFQPQTPAKFLSTLDNYTSFDNFDPRKLRDFEDRIDSFEILSKSILPLGRFGSRNHYIRICTAQEGSFNDGGEGDEDVDDPYEILNEDENEDDDDRSNPCDHNLPQRQLHDVRFCGTGNFNNKKLLVLGRLIFEEVRSYWMIAMDSEHILYALRASKIGLAERSTEDERAFRMRPGTGVFELSRSNENNFKVGKSYGPCRAFAEAFAGAFANKHSRTVNVFNATDTQHVFILGHLELLRSALRDSRQELRPQLLSEITSWTSTPILS